MARRPRDPTGICRLIHVESLATCLERGGLHAPSRVPEDGLPYRSIHRPDVQATRGLRHVPCGPGGTTTDYVPFYFGPRSPMLYQLSTGWVAGYHEGQEPLIYLVSSAQSVSASGAEWVFTDGHALAAFTTWHDDLRDLDQLDWGAIYADQWMDTVDQPDRKRSKQAEFLIHRFMGWNLISGIRVYSDTARARVEDILGSYPNEMARPVRVSTRWYY